MGSVFYVQDMREKGLSDDAFMKRETLKIHFPKPIGRFMMQVVESTFTNNKAIETTIILTLADLYLKNCKFVDNISETGTHGIQLQTSRLSADEVIINYLPDMRKKMEKLQDVTSGFFNIENVSKLILKNKSVISNTLGQEATIAKLQTDSEIYWQDITVKN